MKNRTLETARRLLKIESDAISLLGGRLGRDFLRAVDIIMNTRGRVVVTGMGKSGIICRKIAATLSSTGTPSFFLHPSEGMHGDIGMITGEDIVLAVSNSGETEELAKMLPFVKRRGAGLIAMTGNPDSTLARLSDVVIDAGVEMEACPLGLAPTASTTAALAMGDAIAVALLERRGFREEDFAGLHPAGSLGRRLLKVSQLMHSGNEVPLVTERALMKEAMLEMTAKRLGITGVINRNGSLVGSITDGDLRRALEQKEDILNLMARDVMTLSPRTISGDMLAQTALKKMEDSSITSLFVCDNQVANMIAGIIHMHDLLRAGVV